MPQVDSKIDAPCCRDQQRPVSLYKRQQQRASLYREWWMMISKKKPLGLHFRSLVGAAVIGSPVMTVALIFGMMLMAVGSGGRSVFLVVATFAIVVVVLAITTARQRSCQALGTLLSGRSGHTASPFAREIGAIAHPFTHVGLAQTFLGATQYHITDTTIFSSQIQNFSGFRLSLRLVGY